MAVGLNDAGRGLNIAVVDPKTKEVTRVGHFDTYSEGITSISSLQEKDTFIVCQTLWHSCIVGDKEITLYLVMKLF